jgi:hypothetical protein
MENQLSIIQPNAVTNARYEYSQLQKDFMYFYLEAMCKHMSREKLLQKDLFGNYVIELDLKNICKSNNYKPMLEAIDDLQRKPIGYEYSSHDGTYKVSTSLVAAYVHSKNTSKVQIYTTELSLPYILWLGSGFTAFNKNIALALPSVYAKRMYELCNRWKDKGFCRMSLKEFRSMMNVEDKYRQISELRDRILDVSQKLLQEQADITFTYELRKENKSKAFNWLEIRITDRLAEEGKPAEQYQYVYNFLYQLFRDSRAFEVCEFLAHAGELKKACERFKRLQKDINTGKVRPHGIVAYGNTVLADEFGVPDAMTGRGRAKAKRNAMATEALKEIKERKEAKKQAEAAKKEKPVDSEMVVRTIFGDSVEAPRSNKKARSGKSIGDLVRGL